jgi:hypothetical protein
MVDFLKFIAVVLAVCTLANINFEWALKKGYSNLAAKWLGFVTGAAFSLIALFVIYPTNDPVPDTIPNAVASEATTKPEVKPGTEDPLKVNPDQIISFPNGSMACTTPELLKKAIMHGAKKESTKLNSMFPHSGETNKPCVMVGADEAFVVLSVEYDSVTPEMALIELMPLELVGKGFYEGFYVITLSNNSIKIIDKSHQADNILQN